MPGSDGSDICGWILVREMEPQSKQVRIRVMKGETSQGCGVLDNIKNFRTRPPTKEDLLLQIYFCKDVRPAARVSSGLALSL